MVRTLSIRLVPESAHAELAFRYDPEIVAVIRMMRERRWHAERRRWTIARSEIDGLCRELERRGVRVTVHGTVARSAADTATRGPTSGGELTASAPRPGSRGRRVALTAGREAQLAEAEQELKLRRYSPRTCRAYLKLLRRFLADIPPGPLGPQTMRTYVLGFVERGASAAYHGQLRAVLRFFAAHVLHEPSLAEALPAPRRERSMPTVLAVSEVKRLFT